MSVISLNTVKILNKISLIDQSNDDLILLLIPIIQADIIKYCNYDFRDDFAPRFSPIGNVLYQRNFLFDPLNPIMKTITVYNGTIRFNGNNIFDDSNSFVERGFFKGMDFVVEGSLSNDRTYQIDPSADIFPGKISLLLPPGITLSPEPAGRFILLTKIKFPDDLQLTAAKMIKYQMDQDGGHQKTSERIGDFSANYSTDYPQSILRSLMRYRKIKSTGQMLYDEV
jgi:hypothetical protein